jgi:ABC-type lipoprotein export system ATPase subunit
MQMFSFSDYCLISRPMSAVLPLAIQNLLPIPLRERLSGRSSAIWNTSVTWSNKEHIFIQAPSGTGKTTLIHMLCGLRTDYEGNVQWGGKKLSTFDGEALSALRTKDLSVIFQDMRLFPALTAWQNLEIKRLLTNSVSENEVHSWMSRLGIADRADRPAATLSYGEQQRVAIIRALLQPFQWLLMDEPFSHLDTHNTILAASLIAEVVARNNASFLIADLDDNAYFPYTKKLEL